jgi:hypothetical protein
VVLAQRLDGKSVGGIAIDNELRKSVVAGDHEAPNAGEIA